MGVPPTIEYASLGMADSLILMVLALVVFGPRRLPQIGRQLGKLMYEFRKASNDFKFQMEEELRNSEEADRRKKEEERLRAIAPAVSAELPASVPAPVVDEQFPVPEVASPYPGEALYPVQSSAPEPSATQEETAPRIEPPPVILPPSTGEQVVAASPTAQVSVAEEAALAAAQPGPENGAGPHQAGPYQSAPQQPTAADSATQGAPVTEPVSHHG